MRERELKLRLWRPLQLGLLSLPMRERELKPQIRIIRDTTLRVAPHAGA